MPRRKKYTKKKRGKSAWSRKRSIATQPRSAIADSQLVKLVYGEHVAVDAGAGTTASYVFRANDMFDPNVTGVGHQPRGFDQWMAFYDHFVVIGSRIKAQFMSTGSTPSTDSFIVSITVEDDTTVGTAYPELLEDQGAVMGYVGTGTGSGTKTLYKKFSTKKFFGVTDVLDNPELRGSASAGPPDQAYYHLNVAAADGSSNPNNCAIAVQIEYIAVLRERKNLAES